MEHFEHFAKAFVKTSIQIAFPNQNVMSRNVSRGFGIQQCGVSKVVIQQWFSQGRNGIVWFLFVGFFKRQFFWDRIKNHSSIANFSQIRQTKSQNWRGGIGAWSLRPSEKTLSKCNFVPDELLFVSGSLLKTDIDNDIDRRVAYIQCIHACDSRFKTERTHIFIFFASMFRCYLLVSPIQSNPKN